MAETTIDPELLKKLQPWRTGHTDLELAESIDRSRPNTSHVLPTIGEPSPDFGAPAAASSSGLTPIGAAAPSLPVLSAKEQKRLPDISPGVPAGSSAYYQNKLTKLETPGEAPTTTGGKIKHVLSRIGNIALDVAAPGIAMNIPGTDMFKRAEISSIEPKLERARQTEEAGKERQATEEENVRHHKETEAAASDKDAATLAQHGLMRDAQGNVVADPTSQAFQKNQLAMQTVENVQKYRQAQQDLTEAREEVERAKLDPNSPAFKQAQEKLAMAREAHRVAAANLALHEQEFANKKEEQEYLKPSGQAQSRGSAAQSVLDVMPELKQLVNAHRADMGPIMGRLNRGEIAIGDVDPGIARLFGAMKSYYALQPAVHGFRSAEFVKDLETAIGTLERNPDAFLEGMEGLAGTLRAVAKEGRTFHKRIKEGAPNEPAKKEEGGAGGEKKKPLPF